MPAKDSISIRMTAEDAGAFEEWRKQAKGPELMGDAIEKASHKGKSSIADLAQHMLSHLGHWVSIGAAVEAAIEKTKRYFESLRELEQGQAKAAQDTDAAMRKYFVTQRISGEDQQQGSIQRIGNIAIKRKASISSAGTAATLLSQYGVSREEAEGGALDELLQLQSASAASGQDSDQMSKRVLDIIHRAMPGGKVTAKNIRTVGGAARQLTGQEGFNDQTIDLFAKVATDLTTKGGYDFGTAMALTTAVAGKYDPREGRSMLRGFAKPGMQNGEADFLKTAKQMLGGGNVQQAYGQAVEIGEEGPQALGRESQTGGTLGELGEKKLTHEQIRQRVLAVLGSAGYDESQRASLVSTYDSSLWGTDFLYGDESRVDEVLAKLYRGRGELGQREGQQYRTMRSQMLGESALPNMTIQLKGQDGRDVPHSVEAVGIQGR